MRKLVYTNLYDKNSPNKSQNLVVIERNIVDSDDPLSRSVKILQSNLVDSNYEPHMHYELVNKCGKPKNKVRGLPALNLDYLLYTVIKDEDARTRCLPMLDLLNCEKGELPHTYIDYKSRRYYFPISMGE